MGKIIRNNIEYTGSSNSAGNISYDNTTSELQSTTVQNAITELKDLVDENTGDGVGRFEKDDQGNITGEIFNTYSGDDKNIASGEQSHAEGYETTASGYCAHAEGLNTTASGICSHAGGCSTIATAEYQTVIGKYNIADIIPEDSDTPVSFHLFIIGNGDGFNRSNIVEVTNDTFNVNGDITVAGKPLIISCDTMPTANARLLGHIVQYIGTTTNNYIHGCFYECISDGEEPPAYSWRALMDNKPTNGSGNPVTSDGVYKNTAGQKIYVDNEIRGEIFNNYTGNTKNVASGAYSHAEGSYTAASAKCAHAEGSGTLAYGQYAHAEGSATRATGVVSHAEGYGTTAGGDYSHVEGEDTTASGSGSHAEGYNTTASSLYSHAEGTGTTASGNSSHAEGWGTEASGGYSHAEGHGTIASGSPSHAEGLSTIAIGGASHAEGVGATARGYGSHAGGHETIATGEYQTVIGKYNIADIIPSSGGGGGDSDTSDSDSSDSDTPTPTPASPKHLFIIGNGEDDEHRSNIVEVTEDTFNVNGDITIAGKPLVVQCDTMSAADEYLLGRIVQYVGATNAKYIHGCFYECVSDGKEPPTYSWQITKVIKFDTTPTSGSANAVTSDGIYQRTPFMRGTGQLSACGGMSSKATSAYTIAYGYFAVAAGAYSSSFGFNTKANGTFAHVVGRNNQYKNGDIFEVGNGSTTENLSNILEVNSNSMNINGDIQKNGVSLPTPYTTMPTITPAMLGQIAMYVGTTDTNYTKGWFYIASSDGASEPTYSWTPIVAHVEGLLPDNENYTEFSNGVRLYVSDTEPTGTIPEGSLGVGW